MFKQLISLEWYQFFRSKTLGQSLAIKILIGFLAMYFIASFLILGFGAFFILEESFPGEDPLRLVNGYLIFWFLLSLTYRFFMQQLPVMNIKPLMALPIKKKTVINYLLVKTTLSFFNILPLFFFVPFAIILLTKGYPPLHVIPWVIGMIFLELSINFLNFLINKVSKAFYIVVVVLIAVIGLQYFGIVDFTSAGGFVFNRLYDTPYSFLIPLLLMVLLYRKNFKFLKDHFYLDEQIKEKTEAAKTRELGWLNRFGDTATFLKNDIRMILRNKRPRQVLGMSLLFLFYGLIFFTNDIYKDDYAWIIFAGLFVTGGFLMTFGQLVPSWDSEYYKLLMTQNISYRKYLESKWALMVVGTGIAFILSTPYVYFGWEVFEVIAAGALFNMGLNSFITLWGGALNRIPIELNVKAKAFSNTQGFNFTQLLLILPKLGLPILLFYVPYALIGFQAGVLVLSLSGVLGLIFRNQLMTLVEKVYQKGKYKTIEAYAEKL